MSVSTKAAATLRSIADSMAMDREFGLARTDAEKEVLEGLLRDVAARLSPIEPEVPALHPASAAVNAARALGKPVREDLWLCEPSGPNAVTVHPPTPLFSGQVIETIERLRADFPNARVHTFAHGGMTLFSLLFTPSEVKA